MNDKYYTPCIEEFRVGFEYEELNVVSMYDKGWKFNVKKNVFTKEIWKSGYTNWNFLDKLAEGKIRVKYLDSSDIETCGFIKTKEYSDELIFQKNDGDYSFYELTYQFEENKVCIEQWTQGSLVATVLPKEEWNSFNLFCGTIKNLSELKVLLKQIGVE